MASCMRKVLIRRPRPTFTHLHSKAFVKERIVDGKPIDLDMFGAFIANAAEIRRKA